MGKDCTDDMITSSANQQMKHLSQLMKGRKERKKEQVFVVEGIKMFPGNTGGYGGVCLRVGKFSGKTGT